MVAADGVVQDRERDADVHCVVGSGVVDSIAVSWSGLRKAARRSAEQLWRSWGALGALGAARKTRDAASDAPSSSDADEDDGGDDSFPFIVVFFIERDSPSTTYVRLR